MYGVKLNQTPDSLDETLDTARIADDLGAEILSLADHPYLPDELDGFTLLTTLAARTERIKLNTNVATLGLRPPAMLAKQAATLQFVSGGRFVLGIGAGGPLDMIADFGGPRHTVGESIGALDEALTVLRRLWEPGAEPLDHEGTHFRLANARIGPTPEPPIPVWVGSFKPRMLALTGRRADGWLPTNYYLELDDVPDMQRQISDAATEAGRDPKEIARVFNVFGRISEAASKQNDKFLNGPVDFWVETLRDYRDRLGFDSIVFWPTRDQKDQTRVFLEQVVPRLG